MQWTILVLFANAILVTLCCIHCTPIFIPMLLLRNLCQPLKIYSERSFLYLLLIFTDRSHCAVLNTFNWEMTLLWAVYKIPEYKCVIDYILGLGYHYRIRLLWLGCQYIADMLYHIYKKMVSTCASVLWVMKSDL